MLFASERGSISNAGGVIMAEESFKITRGSKQHQSSIQAPEAGREVSGQTERICVTGREVRV